MKKILMLITATLLVNVAAAQTVTEDKLIEVCEMSVKESLGAFKKAVKHTDMKLRDLYPSLRCNDIELLGFAIKSGDSSISEYIIKRTKRRDLTEIEGMKSQEWFIQNGYENTKAYDLLVDKLC